MKFALTSSHVDFYHKNKFIEIESLINESTLQKMQEEFHHALTEKLKTPFRQNTAAKIFLEGHDLWRTHAKLKKYVTQTTWAEIAAELASYQRLRLGFDQFFLGGDSSKIDDVYTELLQQNISLADYSSVNEIQCGLMICLSKPDLIDSTTESVFSITPGNAVFFNKDFPIDFTRLPHLPKGQYLLLVYVQHNSVYVLNENDPFTHFLKHLGYVFGDRLNDKLNPIVSR